MGGAAGHMLHIYEDLSLTFGDLKQVLRDIVASKVDLFEKVDGQNLFVTFDPAIGQVFAARNLTDIRRGGVPAEEFLMRWKGHPAELPFTSGFKAIVSAIKQIPAETLERVFDTDDSQMSRPFVNLEIICSDHVNVIQYDKNYVIFHSLSTGDQGAFDQFVRSLEGTNTEVDGNLWEFSGPRKVKIDIDKAKMRSLDKAIQSIDSLGMSDDATLSDYVAEILRSDIVSEIPIHTFKQEAVINLVLGKSSNYSLLDLKKDEPISTQKAISGLCTQENARKIRNLILRPIENIVTDFSMSLLDKTASTLASDHMNTVTKIRRDVESSITKLEDLKKTGDEVAKNLLDRQMSKLRTPDSITSSMEGVVFKHPAADATYKLTGSFAMANQLVGYDRRNSNK
jgi:hypothetical protein